MASRDMATTSQGIVFKDVILIMLNNNIIIINPNNHLHNNKCIIMAITSHQSVSHNALLTHMDISKSSSVFNNVSSHTLLKIINLTCVKLW